VCTTTYTISRNGEWLVIPVKNTEYILIKNRVTGTFLNADEQHHVKLSTDSTSGNSMWKMQISPTNDMYASFGTSGKIWNKATNEFIYLNNEMLATSSDVWDHLTSSMWSVKEVSKEELSQDSQ